MVNVAERSWLNITVILVDMINILKYIFTYTYALSILGVPNVVFFLGGGRGGGRGGGGEGFRKMNIYWDMKKLNMKKNLTVLGGQ